MECRQGADDLLYVMKGGKLFSLDLFRVKEGDSIVTTALISPGDVESQETDRIQEANPSRPLGIWDGNGI
jgi:hypothetical protein